MRFVAITLLLTACTPRELSTPCNVDDDCALGTCEFGFCAPGSPVTDDAGQKEVPRDAGQVDPFDAGVTVRDAGSGVVDAGIVDLRPIPVHRYPFEEGADDVIGGAHGELKGGAVIALGAAVMDGEAAYVDLPNGIISALPAVTIEAWVVWAGLTTAGGETAYWQRVFDFGSNTAGEIDDVGGGPFSGTDFIQVTPQMTDDVSRLVISTDDDFVFIDGPGPVGVGEITHIAATFDPNTQLATLYINGVATGTETFAHDLAQLDDVNNWIGRSNYSEDRSFYGAVAELRIYGSALSADDIAASFERGEDDLGL